MDMQIIANNDSIYDDFEIWKLNICYMILFMLALISKMKLKLSFYS